MPHAAPRWAHDDLAALRRERDALRALLDALQPLAPRPCSELTPELLRRKRRWFAVQQLRNEQARERRRQGWAKEEA